MRTRMFNANRQRDLFVVALVDRDAGGGAAQRAAAVGGDHQRRLQCAAASERYRDGNIARHDR